MRELKFRVWDKKTKKFVIDYKDRGHYTELFITLDGKIGEFWAIQDSCSYGESDSVVGKDETPRFVVQEFTGVRDKNGVEIYNGDIVSFVCENYTINQHRKGEVKYFVDKAQYLVIDIDGNWFYKFGDGINSIEVIGNNLK